MEALKGIKNDDVVFIDIETVRKSKDLIEGSPEYEAYFEKRNRFLKDDDDIFNDYIDRGALYPEFAKVICITIGRITEEKITLTSFKDTDEYKLLEQFNLQFERFLKSKPKAVLCGHSIKNFDIPFLFKRSLINRIKPCKLIDVGGLKPWEITSIDTMELWKATGYAKTSLNLLCYSLGVESPKKEISGVDIGHVYYNDKENGLKRISEYCEKDVLSVIHIIQKMLFQELIEDVIVNEPKEQKPETLIERIARTGIINNDDRIDIIKKAEKLTYQEKEKYINNLHAVLSLSKSKLDSDLELDILKAD